MRIFTYTLLSSFMIILDYVQSMDEPRRKHDRVYMNGLEYRVPRGHTIVRFQNGFGFGEAPKYEQGDIIERDGREIGIVKDRTIYEIKPTGPFGEPRIIKAEHGDLVKRDGKAVAVYEVDKFRELIRGSFPLRPLPVRASPRQ